MSKIKKSRVAFGQESLIIKPKGKHISTVIWLHGLGDTGNGWYSSMKEISIKCDWIKFILPTAPHLSITLNGGSKMNGWHDIKALTDLDLNKVTNDFTYRDDSKILIEQLIDNEIKLGIKSTNILVGGFR